jgi:hypothetical protein
MLSREYTRWLGMCLIVSTAVDRGAAAAPGPAASPEGPASTDAGDATIAEANALFEKGSEAYNLGRFTAAIEHFERAYELTQVNTMLYNIAQAHAKRFEVDADPADLRKAKVMFLNFAKIAEATGEDPRDARQRIQQLDAELAAFEARQAEIRAEEARAAAARVEAERLAAERQRKAAEAADLRSRPQKLGVAGYSLLGIGIASGVLLGAIGGESARQLSAQRTAESGLPLTPERAALYDQQLDRAQGLGLAGLVIGATLSAAGIIMISTDAVRRRKGVRRVALRPQGLVVSF